MKSKQQVTFVYTNDLATTSRFYGETLGLELVMDQGPCHIYRTASTAFLGVCACREGRAVEPSGVVISLVTDDVDGWYERLKAKGVKLEGPPVKSETFQVYCFFSRDPEGYRIEFQQFLDPAWPQEEA